MKPYFCFTLLVSLFTAFTCSAPAPQPDIPTSLAPRGIPNVLTIREASDVAERNPIVTVAAIIEFASDVVNFIIDLFEDQAEKEGAFTQQTVQNLLDAYPTKNVIVYHDQDSYYDLSPDAVHAHYELDLLLGFTKGYEIWVFDTGYFQLAGDGGFQNWCIGGEFSDSNGDGIITFFPRGQ